MVPIILIACNAGSNPQNSDQGVSDQIYAFESYTFTKPLQECNYRAGVSTSISVINVSPAAYIEVVLPPGTYSDSWGYCTKYTTINNPTCNITVFGDYNTESIPINIRLNGPSGPSKLFATIYLPYCPKP